MEHGSRSTTSREPALTWRRKLLARLLPRVLAGWPAIAGIALAIVVAHSGMLHLDASPGIAEHYREAIGFDASRAVGIVQLLLAGGLVVRRTRAMSAAALAGIIVLAVANQVVTGRAGAATMAPLALLAWSMMVAWGERRRAPDEPRGSGPA